MFFAILQGLLVLSIEIESFYLYPIFIILIYLTGYSAYYNANLSFNRSETKKVYKEHYKCMGDEFAVTILHEIQKWEKFAQKMMLLSAVLCTYFVIGIKYRFMLFGITDDSLIVRFAEFNIVGVIILFIFDLRRALNKSKKIKEKFPTIAGRF